MGEETDWKTNVDRQEKEGIKTILIDNTSEERETEICYCFTAIGFNGL